MQTPNATPEETPTPAPQAAAAPSAQPQAPAGAQSPAGRAVSRVRQFGHDTSERVVTTAKDFGTRIRELLRFEPQPPEEVNLPKTLAYGVGHIVDGTAINIMRRAMEVIEPSVSAIRALYRSTIGALLHPINTLLHPIETLKNPLHLVTSAARAASSAVTSPINGIHDLADRSVNNTAEQSGFQLRKVPVLGTAVAAVTGFFGKIARGITGAAKEAKNFLTSPITMIDDATAPA